MIAHSVSRRLAVLAWLAIFLPAIPATFFDVSLEGLLAAGSQAYLLVIVLGGVSMTGYLLAGHLFLNRHRLLYWWCIAEILLLGILTVATLEAMSSRNETLFGGVWWIRHVILGIVLPIVFGLAVLSTSWEYGYLIFAVMYFFSGVVSLLLPEWSGWFHLAWHGLALWTLWEATRTASLPDQVPKQKIQR